MLSKQTNTFQSYLLDLCTGLAMWLLVTSAQAQGIWSYTDARGVVHIGNTAPPRVKQLRWLGFDERFRPSTRRYAHPMRLPGYESVRPVLESAAQQHSVDLALITAVAAAESGYRAHAVSHKGAVGLMQVMPATAQRYGVQASTPGQLASLLKDPALNADIGTRYLADLLQMFDGELELALAAYNAGEGAVLRYGRHIPPYPETQQYVARVMSYYRILKGRSG